MNCKTIISKKAIVLLLGAVTVTQGMTAQVKDPDYIYRISADAEKMQEGKFEPTWESLQQYEVPEWFRDAKFGMWTHWGPQCQPERGDWYSRGMYEEGSYQYKEHIKQYGHQSEFGFKDVINEWKAEKWDPEAIVALYKKTGAKYFVALANHHDNMDLWDSKYQPWNSVNMGPKRDIIGEYEKAVRKNGLRFGVTFHAAHAWLFHEPAQLSDTSGPKKGIPYDGRLLKEDGKGKWWEGYDPQDLYAQDHALSAEKNIHKNWHWTNIGGVTFPDRKFTENIYNRTLDLINRYRPDLLYFDDSVLPLYPFSEGSLKTVAHFYNSSMAWNNGKNEAVLTGKVLTEDYEKQAMVWDIEKGTPNEIQEQPWQVCTCIGSWHYDIRAYEQNRYKSAERVVRQLIDVVSKNGNLLLNIPMRGDGSFDDKALAIVEKIGAWMEVNGEGIYATRPWKVFGEGPDAESTVALNAQGFNEGRIDKYTEKEVRYTSKGKTVYAFVMGHNQETFNLKSFGKGEKVRSVTCLGTNEKVQWKKTNNGLEIKPMKGQDAVMAPVCYKITLR
ncbi:alpha-L-fucosidase [Parabacteroides sp. OttesenSCG-928-B22]|nr:alpha-L-fucosidase [Parabacteroides sp. OttesenSCG-928-B22]